MGEERFGNPFIGVFLPHKKKLQFSKIDDFPEYEIVYIPLHSQCINCLNQLLEELNDWVHKPKWVVENLWALSLTFVLTLLDQEFE